MEAAPSQKELLEIEQGKAEGKNFINAAANFLRFELGLLERKIPVEIQNQIRRKSLAPREEYVLKLLLRRLSKSDDLFNGNFWVLLAHLFSIIPLKALASLLGEREFFRSLDEALERILAVKQDGEEDMQRRTSSDEDSDRPTKKQKLRKSDSRTSAQSIWVHSRICTTIASLVQLATRSSESDKLSCSAFRNVLSASSEDAAAVTGKLLQLIRESLAAKAYGFEREQLAQEIPAIVSIWAYRRPDTAGGKPSDQYFTSQCLRPTLQLLVELQDHQDLSETPTCTAACKALERLVALHSVLPLRSLFLAEKGQQWRAKVQAVTWHDFKDLQPVASVMLLGPSSTEVNTTPESSFTSILQYYSIAVRAVPRPTVRRLQQEQPWLDCLFCVCASLTTSEFPRLELDEAGRLLSHTTPGQQRSIILNPNLSRLLTLAEERAVKLSLPVLLYLTTTTLEYRPDNEQWRVLAKIMKQDANIFIPNSGLLETISLLDSIMGLISTTNNEDGIDYPLVRDGIIRPLLSGFTHARDLKGFVALWIRGLQDAIQQRASGDLQYLQSHLVIVWEDELLLKDFEDAVTALTTSTLAHSLITEMLVLLEQAVTRIGPTSDIVSHVAIATSLLAARPEALDSATSEAIFTATTSALSRRSDYQLQRWKFWRLLRQCLTLTGTSANTTEQLQQLVEKQHYVSLSAVSGILNSESSHSRDARLKEVLECFSLAVSRAAKSPADGGKLLETELEHLIAMFSDVKRLKNTDRSEIQGQLQFGSSCAAIILQRPQALRYSSSATSQLIAAMVGCLSLPSNAEDVSSLASLIQSFLLSEELLANVELFNNCCSTLLTSLDESGGISPCARDILVVLPLQGLNKSIAQKFADILVQRLRRDASSASSLHHILPDLGLLEMLIAAFSVSVGQPKKWAEFIDLAEHIMNGRSPPASRPYETALACISKIFDVLWRRCQRDEMSSDMSTSLLAFQSRLRDVERSPGSLSDTSGQLEAEEGPQSSRDLHQPAKSSDITKATVNDLETIAVHINLQISALGPKMSSELAMLVDQGDLDSRSFLLLSAVTCQTSAGEVAKDQSLLKLMSKLATLNFASKANTAADLCLALETCKIILEKHSWIVNQHTVDTLLSSITALTSPSTVQIISNTPSAIFDRLCSLLGLLLSRHRKRLGGRYHLILPALQSLLKCLFFAGTASTAASQTKSQIIFVRSLPSWLRGSTDSLPPKSAEHFTRLLTTICDPSVSSVRHKKYNALTDETKKAKSLAGQYMQYLIMDFCRCSLHGRIPPSSKEKLLPGLYAVLDVMDRETMKGMNGAMDSNGRAVWKALYQDWERFGRWDRR